jgi:hypothetical protein
MSASPPLPSTEDVSPVPPPLPDDAAPLTSEQRAVLRTVAGRSVPVPFVTLAGVDLPGTASAADPVALDDLSVTWGRSEPLDQPTPATGTVRLLDRTGTWAVGRELIGQPLALGFTLTLPDSTIYQLVFFRGRVTSVELEQRSKSNAAAGVLLTLGVSSLLTDLGNRVPFEAWPEETVADRTARLATYTAGVASSITVRTFWQTPKAVPVAATEQTSILDSLTALYSSTGPDRMTYFPNDQRLYFLNRRGYSGRALAQLTWKTPDPAARHSRENAGAYIITMGVAAAENGLPAVGHWLDAAAIDYGDTVSKSIGNRITRVEVSHRDAGTGFTDRVETALVPGTDEALQGVRAARVDSLIGWNNYAQTAAGDLAAMMGAEGAGWSIGRLTVRADLAGGFDYATQAAQLLLCGAEQPHFFFLQRSWFPAVGIRPIFGIIGGVIRYVGGWQIDVDLLPVSVDGPQHAIAWDEIDDGSATYQLEWHDDEHPRALHESVTYEDIGFVGRGLGVTSTPADRGWDQVYSQ